MNKILLSFLSLILVISCSKNISPVDSGLETQTFHFGNGSEPQGIDPHIVTGVPEHHLLIALCEGLTTSNPRGGESLAGAAESWNISDDGKIYTFALQKKWQVVKWRSCNSSRLCLVMEESSDTITWFSVSRHALLCPRSPGVSFT